MKTVGLIFQLSTQLIFFSAGLIYFIACEKPAIKNFQALHRTAVIDPDYSDTVIPPNIAPLNFMIKEPGEQFYVEIRSTRGPVIQIFNKKAVVQIPLKKWAELLSQNRGEAIQFLIFIQDQTGQWQQFQPIQNRIATEPIDSYLVYRLLKPVHNLWGELGIYQRTLENFDESPILINQTIDKCCINCHAFCGNHPDRMIIHTRGKIGVSMLVATNREVTKVDTRTRFNSSPAAYPAWHPNGKLLACSVNKLVQFFHATGESREVTDLASDLILYQVDTNTVTTVAPISSPDRMETFPAWSPDGHYLYFCSAPRIESFLTAGQRDLGQIYDKILYDLNRVRYFPETNSWGELETVLAAAETGQSICFPRISPDGQFLLFCMARYGSFPIFLPSSDLYLMDLTNGHYYKPAINSPQTESFHAWSSNSRWFVFSSKRRDGLCARPYFCYVDDEGKVAKPFVMPQKHPRFYEHFQSTYNIPELIQEPVKIGWRTFSDAARQKALVARLDSRIKSVEEDEPVESFWQPAPHQ